MLDIKGIGSKWAGEAPDTIPQLLEMLDTHPLQRTFELYGNFAYKPTWENADPYPGIDVTSFFGNFFTYSYGFNIYTDDEEIIAELTAAIRKNQQREDYKAQPDPANRPKDRHRKLK